MGKKDISGEIFKRKERTKESNVWENSRKLRAETVHQSFSLGGCWSVDRNFGGDMVGKFRKWWIYNRKT